MDRLEGLLKGVTASALLLVAFALAACGSDPSPSEEFASPTVTTSAPAEESAPTTGQVDRDPASGGAAEAEHTAGDPAQTATIVDETPPPSAAEAPPTTTDVRSTTTAAEPAATTTTAPDPETTTTSDASATADPVTTTSVTAPTTTTTTAPPTTTTSPPTTAPPTTTTTTLPPTTTVPPTTTQPHNRPPAPDFTLQLGAGGTFALSSEPRPVYIVFWAEW